MALTFDKLLGIHQHTLGVRSQRAEVIANNIANADTPGFKSQDINFRQALDQVQKGSGNYSLNRTDAKHFSVELKAQGSQEYRVPNQPDTGDGNTVDVQLEQNLYMQNALEYQMSMGFLDARISGVKKALTGGQ